MKPDGVATVPAEPTEALEAAAIAEEAAKEEQPQEDQRSPTTHDEPEQVQEASNSIAAPPEKQTNSKMAQPNTKTKATVKTRPGTAAPKSNTTASSRPAPVQNRVANGVGRTTANAASKKPATTASEMKKTAPAGAAVQAKKGPSAAAAVVRSQTKAAERKPVAATRPAVTSVNSGTKPAAAATTPSKKPVATTSSAVTKPKTTVPRPATAPAAKPSTLAPKTTVASKTTRPSTAPASHSTTSSASVRPTVTTTKLSASRTVSAPSTARAASLQLSKTSSTTAAAKKDVGKPSTIAAARKLAATKTATTTYTTAKPSKPQPPKTALVAKRPPADSKTTRLKVDDDRPVPTRKVPPSPRNTSTRPALSKMAPATNIQKQGGSSSPVAVKRQTTKPTQSALSLIKGKPAEKPVAEPVEPSSTSIHTISEEMGATVATESVPVEAATVTVQLEEQANQQTSVPEEVEGNGGVQVLALDPSDREIVGTMEPVNVQAEAETPIHELSNAESAPGAQELKNADQDLVFAEAQTVQEITLQELVTTSPYEVSNAINEPPRSMEVVEKAEQLIQADAEEEEEEKEGSQQVSVSDMSGTQPTEESRPGSAGLAGSVWRAGGLLSEMDSEDVSCSQQGASELSAPGVLEGTESMDDLGEASLKGADEGASAGSPDFEKVPDIPANEDDNDYDDDDDDDYDNNHVCDMDVGSERTDDPHRQRHEDEDEDDDVEMASEGITESGLESYGNADEDDFVEDYRLDNLNRMQPPPIIPSANSAAQWDQASCFADSWVQPLQPDPTLPSNPSCSPWQANSEMFTQATHQAWLDVENDKERLSCQPLALMDPIPCSSQLAPVPSAEQDASFSMGLATYPQGMSKSNTANDPEQAAHSCSDSSTPEEIKDCSIGSGMGNQQQPVPVNLIAAAALPDMQDMSIQHERGEEEEEPVTLPADDVLGGPATAPTSVPSSSSATEDEASDTEGEMQISEPSMEPVATSNEDYGSKQVAHSLSTLEEREEACAEMEAGGGSDTPQSATSAASYGFDCTATSNSNAQSTTESCTKSPGIFSLENEEQLPDEAKDPSLIKELNLEPICAPENVDKLGLEHQGDLQLNLEQEYMLCGKSSEDVPEPSSVGGTEPTETGLASPSSRQREEDWDLNAQHPYYSTICEKTESSLAGRNIRTPMHQEVLTIHMTMSPRRRSRPHVDHVTNPPRLPTDLPPRIPSAGPNAQLRRLEHHQQQLLQIEQRREQLSNRAEICEKETEMEKNEESGDDGYKRENELEEKEEELEEQRRDFLQLQIQQQQQELKQRQQIMQWQQELEQQQNKNQNKIVAKVPLSPSGLCTIYESQEISDEDESEDEKKDEEMLNEAVKYGNTKEQGSKTEANKDLPKYNEASPKAQNNKKLIQNQMVLTHLAVPETPPVSSDQPCPLELDWGTKVDIVQQLINQTLLLAGSSCSPLLPGGAGGTLSPLETSLWPNLLPPIAPRSATVTSVSSFSPEPSGSSQGEWTVVELETHH